LPVGDDFRFRLSASEGVQRFVWNGSRTPSILLKTSRVWNIDGFTMKKNIWRAVIEVGFIVFLFYSNLLMGEFERSGLGAKRGMVWAIEDVFTAANFGIAAIAALTGYVLLEFLRKRF
jgi:hypothetical protein